MARWDKIRKLGAYGENLVAQYLQSKGHTVTISENMFDDEKDMTVDGVHMEIKTLHPIYKFGAFCLPSKQERKCEAVDRLIFVKIPMEAGHSVNIYESIRKDGGNRYDYRKFFNGDNCLFYELTNLKSIAIIQNKSISDSLWNLSPSNYKRYTGSE